MDNIEGGTGFVRLSGILAPRGPIPDSDADYFRLSEKDTRAAKATNARPVPTPQQIESVLERSPVATILDRRNRAAIAFTWLTGVRDGALISLKLRHVDLGKQLVDQDPREVKTKNSKQLRTTFLGVGGSALRIVEEWIEELRRDRLWGNDDPLFSRDGDRAGLRAAIRGYGIGPLIVMAPSI